MATEEELKRAYKAFKKRLKLARVSPVMMARSAAMAGPTPGLRTLSATVRPATLAR